MSSWVGRSDSAENAGRSQRPRPPRKYARATTNPLKSCALKCSVLAVVSSVGKRMERMRPRSRAASPCGSGSSGSDLLLKVARSQRRFLEAVRQKAPSCYVPLLLCLLSREQVGTQKGAWVFVRWDHVRRAVPGTEVIRRGCWPRTSR